MPHQQLDFFGIAGPMSDAKGPSLLEIWMIRRNRALYMLILVAIAAVGLTYHALSNQLSKVANGVEQMDALIKSRDITRRFVNDFREYDAGNLFCSPKELPLCSMVTFRSYDDLGARPPLWVFFDALVQIGYANLTADLRSQFNRVVSDVSASLNSFGAVDFIGLRERSDWFSSTTMYVAVLTQASACQQVLSIRCRQGLPTSVAESLKKAADFIERNGTAASAYEMSIRSDAVRLVSKVLSSQTAMGP